MGFKISDYESQYARESSRSYREVDSYESMCGYALDRFRLLAAAKVLANPIKDRDMPLWQHGRIIYSTLRKMIEASKELHISCLDVGTAKGFSALCAQWALNDSGRKGTVISVDVIHPESRQTRNSIVEVMDGPRKLSEFLAPWPEASAIKFVHANSLDFLQGHHQRIHFAFLDGKHEYGVVKAELTKLRKLQQPGDFVVCDDYQIPQVGTAVVEQAGGYDLKIVTASPARRYAIGMRSNGH